MSNICNLQASFHTVFAKWQISRFIVDRFLTDHLVASHMAKKYYCPYWDCNLVRSDRIQLIYWHVKWNFSTPAAQKIVSNAWV